MTALHFAAYNDDPDVVILLMKNGALQMKDNEGNTPVDFAGMCDNFEVLKIFFDDFNRKITNGYP